jgi:predicted metal-dependent hydrolase
MNRKKTNTVIAPVPISKEVFKAEVGAWASIMKVEPKEVHVRPMVRKWGSCSTAGRVSFDLGLLAEPYPLRKEIIVHELLHIKVPNHGKLFKALLKAYMAKDILRPSDNNGKRNS